MVVRNEAVDMSGRNRLCVGIIAGSHGVRGLVRVKSFTAVPDDLAFYRPITDADGGRRFDLEIVGEVRGLLLARIAGIGDRDAADRLRGTELYIERDILPPVEEEGEYYHADLIGLAAVGADGSVLGKVQAVHDFGAGSMIEIALVTGGDIVLPFTGETFPEVDLEGGRLVTVPPRVIDDAGAGRGDRGENGR